MGKFSEANLFGMTIRESANDGSDFTNPDADYRRLFLGEDGNLHLKDSAGSVTDVGGAGGLALSHVGYPTIGASTEGIVHQRQYMKQFTPGADGVLLGIGAYIKQVTAGATLGIAVGVLDDDAGTPDHIIGVGTLSTPTTFLSDNNGAAGDARWVYAACTVPVSNGVPLWLAIMFSGTTNDHNIYYDGSGGDRYFTNGGWRITDADWTPVTTSSNKYSIRGLLLS